MWTVAAWLLRGSAHGIGPSRAQSILKTPGPGFHRESLLALEGLIRSRAIPSAAGGITSRKNTSAGSSSIDSTFLPNSSRPPSDSNLVARARVMFGILHEPVANQTVPITPNITPTADVASPWNGDGMGGDAENKAYPPRCRIVWPEAPRSPL
jgi:hypothetical protein